MSKYYWPRIVSGWQLTLPDRHPGPPTHPLPICGGRADGFYGLSGWCWQRRHETWIYFYVQRSASDRERVCFYGNDFLLITDFVGGWPESLMTIRQPVCFKRATTTAIVYGTSYGDGLRLRAMELDILLSPSHGTFAQARVCTTGVGRRCLGVVNVQII